MIEIESKGSFKNTEAFLKAMSRKDMYSQLEPFARQGMDALESATPTRSGKTADSWGYEIKVTKRSVTIMWTNSNVVDGRPIAILLQFGHGTGTGGYVQGIDYINPAIKPIFDRITDSVWRVVTSA